MVTDNTGPLSYWTLAPRCSSTPGSLGVFSTFFPSHGYHVDKTSKFIPVLGGGEKSVLLLSRSSLPSRHLSHCWLLAFELRTSPTTEACRRPQGKSGLASLQKAARVPGEVQGIDSLSTSQAMGRRPDRKTLCSLLLSLSLVLTLTIYTFLRYFS